MHDELVSGIECGGDGVSRQGGEVGVVYRFGADLYANADRFADEVLALIDAHRRRFVGSRGRQRDDRHGLLGL
jgi:hypothetical protein